MKDLDRRAIVLRKFYDERHNPKLLVPLPLDDSAPYEERVIVSNICRQLASAGHIVWKPSGRQTYDGCGHITPLGVEVIESKAPAPIGMNIDNRQFTIHNSPNVQIGYANAQITGKTAAINGPSASVADREKTDSPLKRVLQWLLTKIAALFTGSGT